MWIELMARQHQVTGLDELDGSTTGPRHYLRPGSKAETADRMLQEFEGLFYFFTDAFRRGFARARPCAQRVLSFLRGARFRKASSTRASPRPCLTALPSLRSRCKEGSNSSTHDRQPWRRAPRAPARKCPYARRCIPGRRCRAQPKAGLAPRRNCLRLRQCRPVRRRHHVILAQVAQQHVPRRYRQ